MRNYLRAIWLLLDIAGGLLIAAILGLVGALFVIAGSPVLAAILNADELEHILNEKR